MNLHFAIKQDRAAAQFNHCSFQLHDDLSDHGSVCHHLAPNLDVEVLIGRLAVGCKEVIADPREVKDVPIEGLEVEIAPRAAYTAIVRGISHCRFKISGKSFL